MVKWWGTLIDYNILYDLNNIYGSKLKIDLSSWNFMLKLKEKADNDFVKFENYVKKCINLNNMRVITASIQNIIPINDWLVFLKKKVKNITFVSISNESYEKSLHNIMRSISNPICTKFAKPCKVIIRGELYNADMTNKNVNSYNGLRKTHNIKPQEDSNTQKYHFFGTSEIFGSGLDDLDTIPSCFAKLTNDNHLCLNHGLGGVNLIDMIFKVYNYTFSENDKIFMFCPFYCNDYCDININLSENDMIDYIWHPNENGAVKVAYQLYNFQKNNIETNIKYEISESKFNTCIEMINLYHTLMINIESTTKEMKSIKKYQHYLKENSFKINNNDIIGSACVNCNPISLGHLSLLEYASKKVDFLYIFVLDPYDANNESVKFIDRINLVKIACKNMPNIKILEGGKYMCTSFICPEYFDKDNKQNTDVNFNLESFYFSRYIAPILNIKTIFLGDEPYCKLTNSYNQHMIETLPKYDINVQHRDSHLQVLELPA